MSYRRILFYRTELQAKTALSCQRRPTISLDGVTVKEVCNHYLAFQLQKLEAGEISPRWFEDCRRVVEKFARLAGLNRLVSDLAPDDFRQYRQHLIRHGSSSKLRGLGVHAITRCITVVRGIFRYAYESDLIDKPIKYGKSFEKPSATLMRKSRQAAESKNGKRLFKPAEILSLLNASDVPLRAMILLGINGGFGNTDCARMTLRAIDFDRALVEFPRPKTGVERTVPLWPETVNALRQSLANRPAPTNEESAALTFINTFGRPWVREITHRKANNTIEKVVPIDGICQEFSKLLRKLGLKRRGLGFYSLRHTFRTWADEVRDQHAIHRIMGHTIPGMSGIYVEEISLDRLRAVVNHVRSKLFGTAETSQPAASTAASAT